MPITTKRTIDKLQGARHYDFWADFWAAADHVGDHYVWPTARSAVRVGRSTLPASHLAWLYVRRKLRSGEELRPTCGRKLCVRPEHQEVVRGAR